MWLFTRFGLFSVVCLNNRPLDGSQLRGKLTVDKSRVAVRARVRKHLEALVDNFDSVLGRDEIDIIDTPGRDYACRIILPKEKWTQVATLLAEDIDYHNFKDRVGETDAPYASVLHRVWAAGFSMQQRQGPTDEEVAERKKLLDEIGKMPTRQYIAFVRREARGGGFDKLPALVWRSLVQRGWAEVSGSGEHTTFQLSDAGRTRLGL